MSTCSKCGAEVMIGDWPFCPHGATFHGNAQRFDPIVVWQSNSDSEKYSFPGPAQLDAYLNQTVKLTGSMQSGTNGEKVFRPESIAPVSSTCS